MRLFLVSCGLALLAGCVTAYAPPKDANTAYLTLETLDPVTRNIWFYHYPGGFDTYRCSAFPTEGMAILHDVGIPTKIYANEGKNVSSVTVKIPAGAPFRFATQAAFISGRDGLFVESTLCQAHLRFTPLRGAKYVAVHGAGGNYCDMSLSAIDDTGGRTQVPHEILPICFDSKNQLGAWKKPIEEKYEKDPGAYR